MKVTDLTRQVIAARRQRRELLARGYEEVGEGGGLLWQLRRGGRVGHVIVDAIIATNGLSVYCKIEPAPR
jgi:hypothetical protein